MGSFEFEYGAKWKALYDMKKQKLESLEREMKLEEDKLVAQMEFARYEHETEMLKNQLMPSRLDPRLIFYRDIKPFNKLFLCQQQKQDKSSK